MQELEVHDDPVDYMFRCACDSNFGNLVSGMAAPIAGTRMSLDSAFGRMCCGRMSDLDRLLQRE